MKNSKQPSTRTYSEVSQLLLKTMQNLLLQTCPHMNT